MRSFITGATGFLGSHLVDLLLAEGHEVTCLVRPTSNLQWLKGKRVRLVQGGLLPDNFGLREGLKNADFCFHAAGVISTTDPQEYFRINTGGARHCLEACLKVAPNLKRFVFVSSIAAAGPSRHENSLDENTTPAPLTLYGQSKLEAERIILRYQDQLPVAVVRPPAIYGPRDVMILPVFRLAQNRRAFFYPAGNKPMITMAYVEDVAAACLWAAKNEKANGEIFYIGDGDLYHWQDIADTLAGIFFHKVRKIPLFKTVMLPLAYAEECRAKLRRQKPRIHRGHVHQFFRSWRISTEKIEKLGFTPRFNLEEGMKMTVAGYRQMGWL